MFDTLGNLTSRTDKNQTVSTGPPATYLTETFQYDSLNRLTQSEITGTGGVVTKAYTYDSLGNLKTKTGLGTYVYGMSGEPHAVSSVDDGQGNVTSYQYDSNGNMTSDSSGRAITWSPFDKPTQITNLLTTLNFTYGVERNRIIQTDNAGKTVHYVGGLYERETTPSGTSHTHYLVAGGSTVAIVKTDNSLNMETRYLHRDHLDSIAAITDETGTVVERLSYDPHGRRRHDADWADMGTVVPGAVTDRGYTGHEHLDSVGLIHMNGRVQDPVLGRFISADPFIPDPSDAQSYNRYSYVRNNPLSLFDPSGFTGVGQMTMGTIKVSVPRPPYQVMNPPSPRYLSPNAWEDWFAFDLGDPGFWDPRGNAGFLNAQSGILGGIVQGGHYNMNPVWHQQRASQIGISLASGAYLAPMTVTITRSGNNTTYVINYNRQGGGSSASQGVATPVHKLGEGQDHSLPGLQSKFCNIPRP